jgi:hypothetical protein
MSETDTDTPASPRFPLHLQMLAGFAIGLSGGLIVNLTAGDAAWVKAVTTYVTGPAGQVFLRLLFMLVIPLLFSALVTGVAEMGDLASLKRVGLRTLVFTLMLSTISVVVALVLVNVIRPGGGVDPALARAMLAQAGSGAGAIVGSRRDQPGGVEAVLGIIPSNAIKAAADDDILALMVFALAIGIGLVLVRTDKTQIFHDAVEGLLEVAMALIGLVIRLAPIAVACFMFNLAALFGFDILIRLSWYVVTVLSAILFQLVIVYGAGVWFAAGMGPRTFFTGARGDGDGLFHREFKRNAAHVAAHRRDRTEAYAQDRALRADDWRHRQPERHRDLRGRHGDLPCAILRGRALPRPAGHGDAGLHLGWHRHRRRPRGLAAGDRVDPWHGRRAARRDRDRARSRSPAGYVSHYAQRDGRPRDRDHGQRPQFRCNGRETGVIRCPPQRTSGSGER